MGEQDWLVQQFEANRAHLRRVAYRMLGSPGEADDAVQEAWLRLSRSGANGIDNLSGWLTTVVGRVCLDMLRSRKSRREAPLEPDELERAAESSAVDDPNDETQLADSLGVALLMVLETLRPAERVAYVLHDMFNLPFEEIAPILNRSPAAARQLASRARRRVQGRPDVPDVDARAQVAIVDAFLTASRTGDLTGLLAVLDEQVVFRADGAARALSGAAEMRGAAAVAESFKGRARGAIPVRVDGGPGVLVARGGKLLLVLRIEIDHGKIISIEAVAEREALRQLDLEAIRGRPGYENLQRLVGHWTR